MIKEALQRARTELGLPEVAPYSSSGAEERLKTREAESWIRMACPRFAQHVTELESRGLMEKTKYFGS